MKPVPEDLSHAVHEALRDWPTGEVDDDTWSDLLAVAERLGSMPFPDLTVAVREILLRLLDELERQSGRIWPRLLRLRFLDGLTAGETANRLHLTENVVYKQQRQAIDELTALLWQAEEAARQEKMARIAARLEIPEPLQLFGAAGKLDELVDALSVPDAPWLVAVTGIGGIGKTSLADAAVRRLAERPRFVDTAWISARQERYTLWDGLEENSLRQPALSIAGLADALVGQLNLTDLSRLPAPEKQAGLRERLKAQPYLVVIDNLESAADYRALVPGLSALANSTKFLLTSRRRLHDFPDVYGVSLEELSRADSLALLRHEAALRALADVAAAPDETLLPVYEAAGGNPLALKLLVGQMHFLSVPRLVADLRQAEGRTIDDLYRHVYWHAWRMMGDDERRVLAGMPLVAESGGKLEQIAALSELPRERLIAALKTLVGLSLVNVLGSPTCRRYGIHRLTESFLLSEVLKWQVTEARQVP